MKMYIVIFDDVPAGLAPVVSAHGSLICYLMNSGTPEIKEWLKGFKKVVVSASRDMEKALLNIPNAIKITESRLDNKLVGIVYLQSFERQKVLRNLPLWDPFN